MKFLEPMRTDMLREYATYETPSSMSLTIEHAIGTLTGNVRVSIQKNPFFPECCIAKDVYVPMKKKQRNSTYLKTQIDVIKELTSVNFFKPTMPNHRFTQRSLHPIHALYTIRINIRDLIQVYENENNIVYVHESERLVLRRNRLFAYQEVDYKNRMEGMHTIAVDENGLTYEVISRNTEQIPILGMKYLTTKEEIPTHYQCSESQLHRLIFNPLLWKRFENAIIAYGEQYLIVKRVQEQEGLVMLNGEEKWLPLGQINYIEPCVPKERVRFFRGKNQHYIQTYESDHFVEYAFIGSSVREDASTKIEPKPIVYNKIRSQLKEQAGYDDAHIDVHQASSNLFKTIVQGLRNAEMYSDKLDNTHLIAEQLYLTHEKHNDFKFLIHLIAECAKMHREGASCDEVYQFAQNIQNS